MRGGVLCGLQPSSSRYGVRVSDAVGGPTWSPGQVQRPSPAAPRSRPRKARRRAGTARRGRSLPATSQPPHIRPPPANSGALAGTQPSRRRRSPIALRTSRTMESLRERSGPASGWDWAWPAVRSSSAPGQSKGWGIRKGGCTADPQGVSNSRGERVPPRAACACAMAAAAHNAREGRPPPQASRVSCVWAQPTRRSSRERPGLW